MPITLNGTTGITTPAIDASAGSSALTTLSVGGNNISAVNSLGFRNRIINGDMRIDQRNAGASITANDDTFPLDRWKFAMSQSSKGTSQQSTVAPSGFINSLLFTSSSAYSVLASDSFIIRQLVEGLNIADLGWGAAGAQTVTLSFWVRSSLTGSFGVVISNSAQNRCYPVLYTISAANTWEQKSITIPGDTTGTWLTTNGVGMRVNFGLGVGSTFSGTSGAWSSSTFTGVTGATSVVGTNGATFYITGVQLEAGSVATPFERRDYGRELMMCQRYFYRVQGASNSLAGPALFSTTGANGISIVSFLPTSMRTPPTCTKQGSSGFATNDDSTYMNYTVNSAAAESATNAIFIRCTYSSGGQINARGYLSGNTHIDCSSEL